MSKYAWVSIYNIFVVAAIVILVIHTGNWLWVFLSLLGAHYPDSPLKNRRDIL